MWVVALLALIVGAVGTLLTGLAWWATKTLPRDASTRGMRALLPSGIIVLAVGVLLPKSVLSALEFETTGRIAMVLASVVGGILAISAIKRRHKGGARALATHVYFAALGATPLGEWVFGVFRMM